MADALKYGGGNVIAADAANAVGVIVLVISGVDVQEQHGVLRLRVQCARNHFVQHFFKVSADGAKACVIVVIRAVLQLPTEPPRILRRLQLLRRWSHEQITEVLPGSARARRAHGAEHRADYPSLWAAIESIAPKIGCAPQTLNDWVKKADVDSGQRPGTTTSDAQRIKELEREVKELRRANDILKTASAFFAQAELDRRLKS